MTYVSVIVDTNGEQCVIASFGFGGDAITREYEIRVLQYKKQNEVGGPAGCLQFFLATTGLVSTFNWRLGKNLLNLSFKMFPDLSHAKSNFVHSNITTATFEQSAL